MDYEKKYNEALERAKQIRNGNPSSGTAIVVCEQIFPELRESEDERVIRTLFYLVKDHDWINGATKDECVSWLEKQKEQKPVDAGCMMAEKQDYSGLTEFERAIHRGFLCAGVENVPVTIIKETAQDCLAQQKPAWSEEDEKLLDFWLDVIDRNDWRMDENFCKASREFINRLKSFRPSWKPTQAQMSMLLAVINDPNNAGAESCQLALREIYRQLKKLCQ